MKKYSEGAAHGRFQPLHKGHLEYLLKAKERCNFLHIGITQPNISSLSECPKDPHRQEPLNNPMTYDERVEMITAVLLAAGFHSNEFRIHPFPIETPEKLKGVLSLEIPVFTTICEPWNKVKMKLLRDLGYKVIVLIKRKEKVYDGMHIRELIYSGDEAWKEQVPTETIEIIEKYQIRERIVKLKTEAIAQRIL